MKKPIISALFLLTACSNQAESVDNRAINSDEVSSANPLEIVYGVTFEETQANFLVKSNGCTKSDDFQLTSEKEHIKVSRINPDKCRAMPHHVWVLIDFPERMTTAKQFYLSNPISPPRFRVVAP